MSQRTGRAEDTGRSERDLIGSDLKDFLFTSSSELRRAP